jgi:PAS domain S-box-containing protein
MLTEDFFKELENESLSPYANWFKGVINAINDGILVIDAQGIVRLINDEYTRITGVEREEIIGKYLPDVRPGAVSVQTLLDGKQKSGVFRKVGNVEYVADVAPIYYQNQVVGIVSVVKSMKEVFNLTKELNRSKARLAQLEKTVDRLHQATYTFKDIIGEDQGLLEVVGLAKRAAGSDLNILIQGESGTGKELFAHAIHNESARAQYPFVPINCSAIPPSLLESELFGYEEGAFTDSKRGGKIGLFELADRGTLFLDEIGDMSFELQAKLLRVLQEGRFRKIGSLSEQEVDVRIIAATNKDLQQMVQKQQFREDLFYRLNGVNISIPALRYRKQDLPLLIHHLQANSKPSHRPRFTDSALDALYHYDWPGNIRELANAVHYAVNMADADRIEVKHLPESIRKYHVMTKAEHSHRHLKDIVDNIEREVIIQTIQSCGRSLDGKKKAAKQLGISLATLYNKMNRLKIDF